MYCITLNANFIIRQKERGLHGKGLLFSSQY